jgi:uncharacterized protein (DUF1330 family)
MNIRAPQICTKRNNNALRWAQAQIDSPTGHTPMPKAYLVGHLTVTNPEGYALYAAGVPALVAAHGGQYLVRGGESTQLEGESSGSRHVVIEFPSRAAALAWYNSDGYQAILPHRQANSIGQIALIDGV